MFQKIKSLFKKRSVTMPDEVKKDVEKVEETSITENENLEASETEKAEDEVVETKTEDTVGETVEETKEETKQYDFEAQIKSLRDEFNQKFDTTNKEFEKKLSEKDKIIEEQNEKITDLEKRVPNSPYQKKVSEEETKTPEDLKRNNVVSGFYGN
jgi:glutaredoxin 2